MYLFTTLDSCHKDVWEQTSEFSKAFFDSSYENRYLNEIKNTLDSGKNCFAVGYYAAYRKEAQYNHSSLLLIQGIEFNNRGRYDSVILFKLIKKFSPEMTTLIIQLKEKSTPLISYVDDMQFLKQLNLPSNFFAALV